MVTMDRRNRTQTRKKTRESQNDIKKLRRENEQLRREIWGLRDEYDKLEEILKKQQCHTRNEKNEDQSDHSQSNSNYSEEDDDEEEDEEDEEEEEEDGNKEIDKEEIKKTEHLENAENQKLSSEAPSKEMHRLKVDFDELSVVDEEEELTKLKDNANQSPVCDRRNNVFQEALNFYSIPYQSTSNSVLSYGFPPECPFIFPSPNFSDKSSPDNTLIIPPCPSMYANSITTSDNRLRHPTIESPSHLGSTGFPSTSDLENSSSDASVQTRSTKVASIPNLPKINSIAENTPSIYDASSIPQTIVNNDLVPELETAKKTKHFFAPLTSKLRVQRRAKNSESSEKIEEELKKGSVKGSVDICINESTQEMEPPGNRHLTFLSSENLFIENDCSEKRNSSNLIVRSLSCQDLPKSDTSESKSNYAKSENALDSNECFRSRVDITLKLPQTPTTPEIPKQPSFDNKLFNNEYHRHFEQYRNYMAQSMKKPLTVQMPDPKSGYYGFIPLQSGKLPGSTKSPLGGSNYENLEKYQALLTATLLDEPKSRSARNIQVTSFETPSPLTLQIPPLTPYDLNLLYSKLPTLSPEVQNIDSKSHCTTKVPAQTQTSLDEESTDTDRKKLKKQKSTCSATAVQRRKERLKKQVSVTSSDVPSTPIEVSVATKKVALEEKNESRSSSSGGESPKKDHRRMSIYFNPKKRPSVSSVRTSKSLSVDIAKTKSCTGSDTVDSAGTYSDREKFQYHSVSNGKGPKKGRKDSTSSESVPWCACWGNGCI